MFQNSSINIPSNRLICSQSNMLVKVLAAIFFLFIIRSEVKSQNNNIYSWQPRPTYRSRPNTNRYNENLYFLRPHSEQVRMNWPEYHIRNAYDRGYIPPDFTRRNYDRDYMQQGYRWDSNVGYDNFLTINLRDRDNFYTRNPRPYYPNYPRFVNVQVNFFKYF
jgi:hypothetical protein